MPYNLVNIQNTMNNLQVCVWLGGYCDNSYEYWACWPIASYFLIEIERDDLFVRLFVKERSVSWSLVDELRLNFQGTWNWIYWRRDYKKLKKQWKE